MYIVYSKNNCPNCVTAKAILKAKGIEFIEKNVSVEEHLVAALHEAGVRQLPYIVELRRNVEYVIGGLGDLKREVF